MSTRPAINDPKFDDLERIGSFEGAALRSERVRIICMMVVLVVLGVHGVLRVFDPVFGTTTVGWILVCVTSTYLVIEAAMLAHVQRLILADRAIKRSVLMGLAVVECLMPTLVLLLVYRMVEINPRVVLVSPGFSIYLMLMLLAVLRLEPMLSVVVGATACVGYGYTVVTVLSGSGKFIDDGIPPVIFPTQLLVLVLGAASCVYVTHRVRRYVVLAVREAEARRQRERLERDLQMAHQIQQRLLPDEMPRVPGYEIAAFNRPADQTGGDYYDWQSLADNRLMFSVADVTGHGIGPALITAACQAYVRVMAMESASVERVLERVNELLVKDLSDGRFVTLALLEYDFAQHAGRLLSAGHGPTFLITGGDGRMKSIAAQGLPLGIAAGVPMDQPIAIALEVGDVIAMFSDGFFEWVGPEGKQFGLSRLSAVITEHRHASAQQIIEAMDQAITQFAAGLSQPDDMTALLIKRVG